MAMSQQQVDNENHFVEDAVFKYVSEPITDAVDVESSNRIQDRGESGSRIVNNGSEGNGCSDNVKKLKKVGTRDNLNEKEKEMDWFLKHNDEDELQDAELVNRQGNGGGIEFGSKSRAVVTGGLEDGCIERHGSDELLKRQGSDDIADELLKRAKKQITKIKSQIGAVDPELASLDNTENDQLVRKAIMNVDHISQHPDIQQYLNTDDSSEKDKDKRHGLSISPPSYDCEAKIALRKAEVLPKVLDPDSPDRDINNLIREAVKKASHIINLQTQSTGKSFDETEEEALEQFVQDYQVIKGMSRRQVCERIWSNERRKDDFWTNICRVLPYRTRSSIYKHVRRKYHIFEQRGKWTPKEDSELARWCMEKEGQWSNIGKVLGRMPEDCRDRWRNYIKCGAGRTSNKWSSEEEEKLKGVITEILQSATKDEGYEPFGENRNIGDTGVLDVDKTLGHDLSLENSGSAPDPNKNRVKSLLINAGNSPRDIINWTIVSERMGGTRSRIQCRYKWNKLLKKEAMNKIKNIGDEDKTWLLVKLKDLGFTEDLQVDWEELAALMPGRRWTGAELKLCYEKLRTSVRHYKRKSINEICKELVDYRDEQVILSKNRYY